MAAYSFRNHTFYFFIANAAFFIFLLFFCFNIATGKKLWTIIHSHFFQRGEIEFEVVYVAPEIDSDDENVEYEDESGHRYRLYLDELEEGGANPAAPNNKEGSGDAKPLRGK